MGKTEEKHDAVEAIAELKTAIQDIIHEDSLYEDDFYLLRWVRAGKFNVKKAEKKLRKAAKWRKENEISALAEQPFPEKFLEDVPIYADAVTKDGVVVATLQAELIDIPRLFKEWGREKVVKSAMQGFAQMEKLMLDLNKRKFAGQPLTENSIEGAVLLVDTANLSASDVASMDVIQTVTEVCKKLKKYYPGLASKLIYVNCTSVVDGLLKIARSILESPVLKFEIYKKDEKSNWKEAVAAQIPVHLLRENFGGTRPKDEQTKRVIFIDRDLILHYINAL
jgi:hypothetical protein